MNKILIITMLLMVSFSGVASDNSNRGEHAWSPEKISVSAAPPLLDSLRESSGSPIYSIKEVSVSAPDKFESIRAWNRGNNTPLKIGFTHTLASPAQVEIDLSAASLESNGKRNSKTPIGQLMQTADGDVMWSATIEVDNSYRLRLHLSDISLPAGAKMWVSSDGDEVVGPFDMELAGPGGDIWTPSVAGPEIRLVIMLPESNPVASFNIVQVAQIFRLGPTGEPLASPEAEGDLSCLKQSLCVDLDTFPKIEDVEAAVGLMEWMIGDDEVGLCTGGLINDKVAATTIPYFLSANHCFDTQEVASTLEVFWDYRADDCDGTKPDQSTLPRSSGATLKATGVPADFLLLELNAIPADRYFLGYDLSEAVIAPGSILHRVHNPGGDVQSYSQTRVSAADEGQVCRDSADGPPSWTTETHIWHESIIGGTIGGSSGSPVLTPDGDIVGQLSGSCGDFEDCDMAAPTIDGKLISYWPEVAPFLDPENNSGSSDLSLTVLDVESGSFAPGGAVNIAVKITNAGDASSGSYNLKLYASTDTSITSSDTLLFSGDLEALAAGGSYEDEGEFSLPADIPSGTYYIGGVLTPTDSNPVNNTRFDPDPITVTGGTSSDFTVNAALSGAWYNPSIGGQGFLLEVYPGIKFVFVAWFTFDAIRPPDSYTAIIGEPGHRWLTAQGNYTGNQMVLAITNTSGGVFSSGTPAVSQVASGTMTLTFISCAEATVAYHDIPGVQDDVISLQRLVEDNVGLCTSLSQAAQAE